ncbi:MAG: transcription-repair coupling factor, partial [Nitrosomonas sp.]|nr:transcription-repair coupling factor [Nitrosomonas sp.]
MSQQLSIPSSHTVQRSFFFCISSDALYFAQLAQHKKPLAVITAHALDAQRLMEEILFFAPELSVHLLPDWETLPYDIFSPHHDLVSERLATLYQVMTRSCDLLIAPLTTSLYRILPREYLAAHTLFLTKGERLDIHALRAQMSLAGYAHVSQVLSPGEYSVRGGLIDLFPMGSAVPFRVDLMDDEIDTIRTFDVDTQRSIYPVNEIRLLPAREFPLDEKGRACFRSKFREKFEGDPTKKRIYKDISNGIAPAGIEYYLPLFFEQTATLFDYLPDNTLICLHRDVRPALDEFWRDTQSRYQLLRADLDRPLLPPEELFLPANAFFSKLKPYPRIEILPAREKDNDTASIFNAQQLPDVQVNRHAENPLEKLTAFINHFTGNGGRILIHAESMGRRELMADYLNQYHLHPVICESYAQFLASAESLMLCASSLNNGFILEDDKLAFITEAELYVTHVQGRRERESRKTTSTDNILRDLS